MTYDEEIIKEATEIYEKNENAGALVGDLLRIIKSQKSEIEKKDTEIDILIRKKEALRDEISELMAEVESLKEAIKEFAEKFKEKVGSIVTSCQGYEIYETKQYQISAVDFDNLVKELTESKNDLEG